MKQGIERNGESKMKTFIELMCFPDDWKKCGKEDENHKFIKKKHGFRKLRQNKNVTFKRQSFKGFK